MLAASAIALQLLHAWATYQRDLALQSTDFAWTPSYWETVRYTISPVLTYAIALGIGLVIVAFCLRSPDTTHDARHDVNPGIAPFREDV